MEKLAPLDLLDHLGNVVLLECLEFQARKDTEDSPA